MQINPLVEGILHLVHPLHVGHTFAHPLQRLISVGTYEVPLLRVIPMLKTTDAVHAKTNPAHNHTYTVACGTLSTQTPKQAQKKQYDTPDL